MKISIYKRPRKDKKKLGVYLVYAPEIPHPKKEGKTLRFQALGEWIYKKPATPFEKEHNFVTLDRCQKIKNKIENEHLKEEIYTPFELERLKIKENGNINFIDLMREVKDSKPNPSSRDIFKATILLLIDFNNSDVLKLKNINVKYIDRFRRYLLNANSLRNIDSKLSNTTASHYLQTFKSTLKYAFDTGLLKESLYSKVTPITITKSFPVYLNENEIQLLINNKCDNDLLYRVTFFMLLTGLRISDVLKLKWSELIKSNDSYLIRIRIKKNNEPIEQPITEQTVKLMGKPMDDDTLVFDNLNERQLRDELVQWCYDVGIKKKITWHKLRHTFAINILKSTGNIFLLQKLLHQRDIKSTMVYAHILDKDKRNAMDNYNISGL